MCFLKYITKRGWFIDGLQNYKHYQSIILYYIVICNIVLKQIERPIAHEKLKKAEKGIF